MKFKKITKDMLIGEINQKYPETIGVMLEYGLHCVGCHVAFNETIEQGALAHGLNKKKINEMIKKMNEKIKEK